MRSLVFLALIVSTLSRADTPIPGPTPCFDFSKKIDRTLRPHPVFFKEGTDTAKSELGNPDWAEVSGVVNKPIQKIIDLLKDPLTIRNRDNTKVTATEVPSDLYYRRTDQDIRIKPVFFLTVEWKETWVFDLRDGTKEKPLSMIIAYQKVSGSSHIKHLCGNFYLQALKPDQTGVYINEELEADQQDAKNVLEGIQGTLKTLREKAP